MNKPAKYELILSEIDKIAEKVDLFQNGLQPLVYNTLVEALVGESAYLNQLSQGAALQQVVAISDEEHTEVDLFELKVQELYSYYILDSLNDMQFSAFVAYCYTIFAPDGIRENFIGEKHFEKISQLVGRELPKRVSGTLHNAKNVQEYLIKKGKDMFQLSDAGKIFVTDLLKGDD